jgi:tRNA pseudouridine55 synthase
VRVVSLVLRSHGADRAALELAVSKGYYVRALARDLGERLGVPAHLFTLRRTRSGAFDIAEARSLPLPPGATPLPLVEVARRCLPVRELTEIGSRRATLGQTLVAEHFAHEPPPREGPSAWLRPDGELVAVGSYDNDALRVLRGFGQRTSPTAGAP